MIILKKRNNIRVILIILVIIIMILLTIYLYPYMLKLKSKDYREDVSIKLKSMGFKGFLLVTLLNIIQVVLAFLPGEIIEILCGMMYGAFIGLIVCEIGIALGTTLVYFLVKRFKRGFAQSFINIEKYEKKWNFLSSGKRLLILISSFLLIPGLPKDFISFLVPFTKVKLHKFLIINFIFRIPSILTSTYLGGTILNNNIKISLTLYGIQFLLGIIGFIYNKKIGNKIDENIHNT